jgi:hypothetical protein
LHLAPGQTDDGYRRWFVNTWQPDREDTFEVPDGCQPIYKLHGSSNWIDGTGAPLLVMGGGKSAEINQHPLLSWYAHQFAAALQCANTRLMIIGYGFGDLHINEAVVAGVRTAGLQIFNISPQGSAAAEALDDSAPNLLEQALIGASRRRLSETFGGDDIEHRKVMRFFSM